MTPVCHNPPARRAVPAAAPADELMPKTGVNALLAVEDGHERPYGGATIS